jgi:hypothetical protein
MKPTRGILIAVDSVGIDPLGHDRSDSVYCRSTFLFPKGAPAEVLALTDSPVEGALVETDVTDGHERGAMECALTYTSIFTGQSAIRQHGLMQGLGLNDAVLEALVAESNLFRLFPDGCLANALFPAHLEFLGGSYVQDLVPHVSRQAVEDRLHYQGKPVRLTGKEKWGLAELFTLGEINQNIFVHAAREAGVRLRTYDNVRRSEALTSSMTHELEGDFNLSFFGQPPLPPRSPEQAASILAGLAEAHSFVFYKYQIPDLVSHTGRVELARAVFAVIERFVRAVLEAIDPCETVVVVTSDHGHLEQVAFSHGHPKSKVPTWYFGPDGRKRAERLRTPEAIFQVFAELAACRKPGPSPLAL